MQIIESCIKLALAKRAQITVKITFMQKCSFFRDMGGIKNKKLSWIG
jgi:hypothetical protein